MKIQYLHILVICSLSGLIACGDDPSAFNHETGLGDESSQTKDGSSDDGSSGTIGTPSQNPSSSSSSNGNNGNNGNNNAVYALEFAPTGVATSQRGVNGSSDAISMEAWVKLNGAQANNDYVTIVSGNLVYSGGVVQTWKLGICFASGAPRAYVAAMQIPDQASPWAQYSVVNEGNADGLVGDIDAGQWHHVAAVVDLSLPYAERFKIYVDGALVESADGDVAQYDPLYATPVLEQMNVATGKVTVGNDHMNAEDRYFPGAIDEVAVYDVALSPMAIDARYNAGQGSYLTGTETGLVFGAHFDEGTGNTAENIVDAANSLQTSASTWVSGWVSP